VSGAPATAPDTVPRLELRGIVKRYGEVITRDAVSRGVMPRQIHAVRGENGAARSTRVKIVYGARCGRRRRDPVAGRPAVIRSPGRGARAGHRQRLAASRPVRRAAGLTWWDVQEGAIDRVSIAADVPTEERAQVASVTSGLKGGRV
jgi:hypothetical protein